MIQFDTCSKFLLDGCYNCGRSFVISDFFVCHALKDNKYYKIYILRIDYYHNVLSHNDCMCSIR